MHIAILTFDGFNELDSLIAFGMLSPGVNTLLVSQLAASVFTTALPAQPDMLLQVSASVVVVFNALAWHFFLAALFGSTRVQAIYGRTRGCASRVAACVVGALGLHLFVAVLRESRR